MKTAIKSDTAHEWKRKLSDTNRCGSCLFVAGGWEHQFSDGHIDTGYFCILKKLSFPEGWPTIAFLEKYESDTTPVVFHYQKACANYHSVEEYELKEINPQSLEKLPDQIKEEIKSELCCDEFGCSTIAFFVIKLNSHAPRR